MLFVFWQIALNHLNEKCHCHIWTIVALLRNTEHIVRDAISVVAKPSVVHCCSINNIDQKLRHLRNVLC